MHNFSRISCTIKIVVKENTIFQSFNSQLRSEAIQTKIVLVLIVKSSVCICQKYTQENQDNEHLNFDIKSRKKTEMS